MLNITKNRIDQFVKLEQFKSGQIFKEQKALQNNSKTYLGFCYNGGIVSFSSMDTKH